AGTAPCRPFSIGKKIVFDFEPLERPEAASSTHCLDRPNVQFYRLDMWIRVFRAADLSYQEAHRTEFEVHLAMDGSLREARLVVSESGAFDETARRALEAAGPFGPLFGELSCLRDTAFRFRFADPRKPAAGAL
ncbi:MAG: TonB C-terminal domain-containing protein, partial [Myxococcales bacterium]|nr:TonB C-terminal domain-containing protein [Myxococcales bacterium]